MKYRWITNVCGDEAFEKLVKFCNENLDKDYILGLPLSKYESLNWIDIHNNKLPDIEYKDGVLFDVYEDCEYEHNLMINNQISFYIPTPRIIRRLRLSATQEELIEMDYRGIYEC